MPERPYHVLFLCTGNSARSILAESLLNHYGGGQFCAFSAGSHPRGAVHPAALALLQERGLPTAGMRSKAWDEFAALGAPTIDCVITVCDGAAGESCPIWPGRPVRTHWGIADPAEVAGPGEQQRQAFLVALRQLEGRIKQFIELPISKLDAPELQARLGDIHRNSKQEPGAA